MNAADALAQPLSLRTLLDEAARRSRRHFAAVYPGVAVPLAVLAGLLPLVQWGVFPATMGAAAPGTMAVGGFVLFMAFVLAWLAIYGLGFGALIAGCVDALAGRPVSMRRAWWLVLRPKALATLILSGIVSGLGFVFCVLPGIYLSLLLSLTVAVLVDEGLYGTRALGRSAELTRYNPHRRIEADPRLKVFVVFFVGGLLGYALNLVVQLPFAGAQQVLMFREVAAGRRPDPVALGAAMVWLQVPMQVLGSLTRTAVNLYTSFGLGLLFFDVKARKEGLDLEAAVARLVESRLGARARPSAPEANASP
jgi:uncharacterized membrane protein